jgi:hypothetical protein
LLDDRIEFKPYAAEQHLNKIKEIANVHGDISKYNARIEVEVEGPQHSQIQQSIINKSFNIHLFMKITNQMTIEYEGHQT